MNRQNYDKLQKQIIASLDGVPTLLLHSCCAPCSSAVLERLSRHFAITVLYYNPNITDESEYLMRIGEQKRLIESMKFQNPVGFVEGNYCPESFFETVKGLEKLPEGGERCFKCYALRLEEAAKFASEHGFDYFTTTLSISPLKNADKLNEIGQQMSKKYGVKHLPSDFKKNDGYKRSIELSKEYSLYRQNYCGCIFSKTEAQNRQKSKQA